jgi:hypothetical protein
MANLVGETDEAGVPAVSGRHAGEGNGGVFDSVSRNGVFAASHGAAAALLAINDDPSDQAGVGVHAKSRASGVIGESSTWMGVFGFSESSTGGHGIMGRAVGGGAGAVGESTIGIGVFGKAEGTGAGVMGVNEDESDRAGVGVHGRSRGTGVIGESSTWMGVFGFSQSTTGGHGVMGRAVGGGVGAVGESTIGIGVMGISESGEAAIRGDHKSGGLAGAFNGHVKITGDLTVDGDVRLTGADLAEQFGVVGELAADPGSVVVLAGDDCVRVSDEPYDRRVAGVVSGAASYRPAIVLSRRADADRRPLALSGRVWCKVDADWGPVSVGDLLTTSPTPGHAMRATDPGRAFGAVIGKALGPLESGRALLPVLVALQ